MLYLTPDEMFARHRPIFEGSEGTDLMLKQIGIATAIFVGFLAKRGDRRSVGAWPVT